MSTPNPGSPEAMEAGCLCPVIDNHYGRGFLPGQFVMVEGCPLHDESYQSIVVELEAEDE